MYIRPGNLLRLYIVERPESTRTPEGRAATKFKPIGMLSGVLASASPKEVEAWRQRQHVVSNTIVQAGSPKAKEGDRLIYKERTFYVQGVDHIAEMGLYTIYYLEERQDRNG